MANPDGTLSAFDKKIASSDPTRYERAKEYWEDSPRFRKSTYVTGAVSLLVGAALATETGANLMTMASEKMSQEDMAADDGGDPSRTDAPAISLGNPAVASDAPAPTPAEPAKLVTAPTPTPATTPAPAIQELTWQAAPTDIHCGPKHNNGGLLNSITADGLYIAHCGIKTCITEQTSLSGQTSTTPIADGYQVSLNGNTYQVEDPREACKKGANAYYIVLGQQ